MTDKANGQTDASNTSFRNTYFNLCGKRVPHDV